MSNMSNVFQTDQYRIQFLVKSILICLPIPKLPISGSSRCPILGLIVTSSDKPRKISVLNFAKWPPHQSQNWLRHTSAVSYFTVRPVGYESWNVCATLCGFVCPKMSTRELKITLLCEKSGFYGLFWGFQYIYIIRNVCTYDVRYGINKSLQTMYM